MHSLPLFLNPIKDGLSQLPVPQKITGFHFRSHELTPNKNVCEWNTNIYVFKTIIIIYYMARNRLEEMWFSKREMDPAILELTAIQPLASENQALL